MAIDTVHLLDVVALTVDIPDYNLWRRQVGTVVETLYHFTLSLIHLGRQGARQQRGSTVSRFSGNSISRWYSL